VRIADLTLLVLDATLNVRASLAMHGRTIADATTWLRGQLTELGADGRRYTLTRHYVIPTHPVADGATFDTGDHTSFEQLSRWFACGADELEMIRRSTAGASDVRCWPHHFDIATLVDLGAGHTMGVGLEPGDGYYDEPYFYVNMRPQPPASALTLQLEGRGTWHTNEWIGAVLLGSRISGGADQRTQIRAFLDSATRTARELIASAEELARRE
jgi:hypothetical protein